MAPRELTKRCTVMVDKTSQDLKRKIPINLLLVLHSLSVNSSCDTNKRLIVDFYVTIKRLAVGLGRPNLLRAQSSSHN